MLCYASIANGEEPEEPLPFAKFRIVGLNGETGFNQFGIIENVSNEELIAREEEFKKQIELEELHEEARKSDNGIIVEKQRNRLGYNCVSFVRNKVENLPQNLWTTADKKEIVNSREPKPGDVAITAEGHVGHLAIVIEVKEDTITIEEGNFIRGYRTVRIIKKDLPLGYWSRT